MRPIPPFPPALTFAPFCCLFWAPLSLFRPHSLPLPPHSCPTISLSLPLCLLFSCSLLYSRSFTLLVTVIITIITEHLLCPWHCSRCFLVTISGDWSSKNTHFIDATAKAQRPT